MGYCYFKCCCTEMAPVLAVTWNIAFQARNKATWNSMSQPFLCRIYESIQDKRRGKTPTKQTSDRAAISIAFIWTMFTCHLLWP